MDQVEQQLDGARLGLVALLAVITDEQFGSVKAALEAVDGLSETCHAALEELCVACPFPSFSGPNLGVSQDEQGKAR